MRKPYSRNVAVSHTKDGGFFLFQAAFRVRTVEGDDWSVALLHAPEELDETPFHVIKMESEANTALLLDALYPLTDVLCMPASCLDDAARRSLQMPADAMYLCFQYV